MRNSIFFFNYLYAVRSLDMLSVGVWGVVGFEFSYLSEFEYLFETILGRA
jgi:hypothetical protein